MTSDGRKRILWSFVSTTETITPLPVTSTGDSARAQRPLWSKVVFIGKRNEKSLFLSPDHDFPNQSHFGHLSLGDKF